MEKEPEPNEECDHLDCTIYLAKQKRDGGPKDFMLGIALAAFFLMLLWGVKDFGLDLMILGVVMPLAFGSLINGFRAGNNSMG